MDMTAVALALCSTKGGTGKTTLAYNIAERARAHGLRVAMVDYDPQEVSVGLQSLRGEPGWPVLTGRIGMAGSEMLDRLKEEGEYDLLVCDMPGTDSMFLSRMLGQMELVLSPVGVGAADLLVAASFAWLVRDLSMPVVFVANNVPAGARRRRALLETLEGFEVEVCPEVVQNRVAHLDALRLGEGVCELAPRSAAAGEVCRLWAWVWERLDIEKGVDDDIV